MISWASEENWKKEIAVKIATIEGGVQKRGGISARLQVTQSGGEIPIVKYATTINEQSYLTQEFEAKEFALNVKHIDQT